MKIIADEGMEARIVKSLRSEGYDIIYIAEDMFSLPDIEILQLGLNTKRVVLTKDKDFGELVFREKLPHSGVVLIRLAESMPTFQKAEIVTTAFQQFGDKFENSFSVIDEKFVRIRTK